METTRKIFGRDVFETNEHGSKNKIAQAGTIFGLIEKSTDRYTESARDVIGKEWPIENPLGQAFDLDAYDGCDHLLKRDMFAYAFSRGEDGMLLSDDRGNVLGAFRIDHKARMIKNESYSVKYVNLAITESDMPGPMLDSILLKSGAKVLYAIAFTYADGRKAG